MSPDPWTPEQGAIIPLYEYSCKGCGHAFEALVRGSKLPSCPECDGVDLERCLSLPTVQSAGSHDKSMRAARKRDARLGAERTKAQREYELHHDDH